MSETYIYEATVCLGGDGEDESAEFDVKASFTVAWGSPETGCFGPVEGYDPGSDSEVENVKVIEIEGLTSGWTKFTGGYLSDEKIAEIVADTLTADHSDRMICEAGEEEAGRAEYAAEQRVQSRREALAEGF